VKRGLLLNVVVGQRATVLKLLSSKNETLLVGWDTLLVLDLRLHIVDGIRRLNLKGDGLSGEGLDEDLHSTTETEHKMKGGLLLDVVIRKSATVLELLSSEDKTLLIRGDSLLVLNLALNVVDGVGRLNLESDGLSSQSLNEDLHVDGLRGLSVVCVLVKDRDDRECIEFGN